MVFGIASAPTSLNPILATDATSERVNALLYAPLVQLDEQGRAAPGVVSWEQIDEHNYRLTLAGHLVRFVDGTTPNRDDLLATLRAARDRPASPHAATLKHVKKLSPEPGGRSVLVELSRPDPSFAEKLHIGLIPAKRPFESLARDPVGSGRYRFVQRDAQDNLVLQRRKDDLKVRFEVVPDPTMRALKMLRGEVDILQNDLPYELYTRLRLNSDIELHSASGTTFAYLGFNLEDELLADVRVRRAIAHAIDRPSIVRHLFREHADPTNTLLAPGHWAAATGLASYQYDPQQAMELLRQAGFSAQRPLRLVYKTSTDPFRLRVASALQAQLAEVGIELSLQSFEWGTFFGDIKAGRFQLYSLSWVGIRSPDIFRYVFHSASLPPQGANRGRYSNPRADALIEQAERLPPQQAQPLLFELQQLLHRDLVYVPLWHERNLLLSRGLGALQPTHNGSYDFLDAISLRYD